MIHAKKGAFQIVVFLTISISKGKKTKDYKYTYQVEKLNREKILTKNYCNENNNYYFYLRNHLGSNVK